MNQVAYSVQSGLEQQDIVGVLSKKAEKTEVEELRRNKTNKCDSENQMKAIDIIHKQVTHTVVLLIEVVKQLENEKNDSVSLRQNKRIYLMQ